MDPEVALVQIRRLSTVVRDRCARGEDPDVDGAASDLADSIIALDQWLSAGGFKPKAWASRRLS